MHVLVILHLIFAVCPRGSAYFSEQLPVESGVAEGLKGWFTPKKKMLSAFNHPHVIPNLQDIG